MRQHAHLSVKRTFTRRMYLACRVMLDTGCDIFTAMEAVSSTAIEHPEWDMNEVRTWPEWERDEWCP